MDNVKTIDDVVAMLRTAADAYDRRRDTRADTCRDIAGKVAKLGGFYSDAQRDFAEKLVQWSTFRSTTSGAPSGVPVNNLFKVMQRHAKFYAGDLVLSRRNADTLVWVVWKDTVCGKISDGQFHLFASKIGPDAETVRARVMEFNADPLAAAIRYGKLSGVCCSCGRDLTNDKSIDLGIGPVCREKFM